MQFPLLGLARDFHPLDNAHAERTKKPMAPFTLGIIGFISDKYTCQIHSIGYPSSFIISLRTLTFAVEAKEDIGVMKKWDIGHERKRKCAQVGQRACPCWVTCFPHLGKQLAQKRDKNGVERRGCVTTSQTYRAINRKYNDRK